MKTALIMLVAGLSSRFGGDKLMAEFHGAPVAERAAELWRAREAVVRLAVVPSENTSRQALFAEAGWALLKNDAPEDGQARSLSLGIGAAREQGCDTAVIALADMPFVVDSDLDALMAALSKADAVMSEAEGVLMPPAAFKSTSFGALEALSGDAGAKRVFMATANTQTAPLSPLAARDIDTQETLDALNRMERLNA